MMVLSNKKLKQKLRAELSSLSQASNPDFTSLSLSHSPLKKFLDSTTPKFRLSKREKRRERSSLQQQQQQQQPDATREGVDGHSIHGSKKEDPETKKSEVRDSAQKKKNDKKRKRKVDDDEVVNGDVKVAKKSNKKSEVGDSGQKKKNDKKRKRKVDDDEVVNGDVKVAKKSNKRRKMKQKKAKKTDKKGANRGDTSEASELAKSISSEQNGDVPTKVYVGGIPYYSTEDDIRSYFDGCGTITEVDSMKFPESGKFRGIAIINFKTEAAAKRALALDGSDMGGFFLKIQPYKRTQTSKASKFAPKPMEGYNRIYVGNLPWDITEDQLRKLFSTCSISSIRFGMDKETGEFRGYAHVDFTDNQSLKMAVALDQKVVCGRPVRITCAVPLKKPMTLESDVPKSNGDEIDSEKSSSTANANGKMKRRTCYECGEKGHISSACPKKQAVDSGTR